MSIRRRSRRTTPAAVTSALVLAVLALAIFLYRSIANGRPYGTTPIPTAGASPSSDWIHVYFTEPNGPNAKSLRGGPDSDLAAAIEAARLSVDVAVFELDLWSVRDALIDAHRRGVSVRVVTDSDNIDNEETRDLKEAGIQVLGDRRESLMHNKFAIIDRREVWSGSMNFTINDAYKNNNNLIRMRSSQLADDYTNEFEEMFIQDQFGLGSPANTPYPNLAVEGTHLDVYFSPDDGAAKHIIARIQDAQVERDRSRAAPRHLEEELRGGTEVAVQTGDAGRGEGPIEIWCAGLETRTGAVQKFHHGQESACVVRSIRRRNCLNGE